jgi:hypothetical protein
MCTLFGTGSEAAVVPAGGDGDIVSGVGLVVWAVILGAGAIHLRAEFCHLLKEVVDTLY